MNGQRDHPGDGFALLHGLARKAACALTVLALLSSIAIAEQVPERPTKRVLLISTGSRLSPGFDIVDQQILQALRTIDSARIQTYAENLDIVRFPAERSQRFSEYLAARYAEQPPDLVILDFVGTLGVTANSLTQLFPDTPIVVAGFTGEEIRPEQLGNLVSGFVQRADAAGALDLILRLHSGLRRIVVIGGTSAWVIVGSSSLSVRPRRHSQSGSPLNSGTTLPWPTCVAR